MRRTYKSNCYLPNCIQTHNKKLHVFRSPATPSGDIASGSYSLSDPEVLARIGNRAVKTVNKSNSKFYFIILQPHFPTN